MLKLHEASRYRLRDITNKIRGSAEPRRRSGNTLRKDPIDN